jgi:hypothetical protein
VNRKTSYVDGKVDGRSEKSISRMSNRIYFWNETKRINAAWNGPSRNKLDGYDFSTVELIKQQ